MSESVRPQDGQAFPEGAHHVHYKRFDSINRILHGCLMTAFLGLSLTGIPLVFSHERWAAAIFALGNFKVASTFHRIFATLLILTFAVHLYRILYRVFAKKDYGMLWGPRSMVPQPRDLKEMLQHMRWFLGLGQRPKFDHFTYWEKFDYWAVFWGMGIIGGSGIMLWLPKLFSRILPGWVFNVATLVHGEEALLAVVFIFTVHFFNGHLRPEKLPMDTVIFTGRVSEEELKDERPGEWERLQAEGGLEKLRATPPSPRVLFWGRVGGSVAVGIGLVMVILTISALVR